MTEMQIVSCNTWRDNLRKVVCNRLFQQLITTIYNDTYFTVFTERVTCFLQAVKYIIYVMRSLKENMRLSFCSIYASYFSDTHYTHSHTVLHWVLNYTLKKDNQFCPSLSLCRIILKNGTTLHSMWVYLELKHMLISLYALDAPVLFWLTSVKSKSL